MLLFSLVGIVFIITQSGIASNFLTSSMRLDMSRYTFADLVYISHAAQVVPLPRKLVRTARCTWWPVTVI